MKSIPLTKKKERVISSNGTEEMMEFNTVDLIRIAVHNVPPGGIDITEMIKRQKILDNIDNISEDTTHINFALSDIINLKRYVAETKWGVVSKSIIEFHNELL